MIQRAIRNRSLERGTFPLNHGEARDRPLLGFEAMPRVLTI